MQRWFRSCGLCREKSFPKDGCCLSIFFFYFGHEYVRKGSTATFVPMAVPLVTLPVLLKIVVSTELEGVFLWDQILLDTWQERTWVSVVKILCMLRTHW